MKKLTAIIVLAISLCLIVNADIRKRVDAFRKAHWVDTNTPIYTRVDEYGKVYCSDRPEYECAVSV